MKKSLSKKHQNISPKILYKSALVYYFAFQILVIAKIGGLLNIHIFYRLVLSALFIVSLFECSKGYLSEHKKSHDSEKKNPFNKWEFYLSLIEIIVLLA